MQTLQRNAATLPYYWEYLKKKNWSDADFKEGNWQVNTYAMHNFNTGERSTTIP